MGHKLAMSEGPLGAMGTRLPQTVAHYGKYNPETKIGGVETFARNLRLVFEQVHFLYPGHCDWDEVRREGWPVICDNHWALDIPADIRVIAFQHGVAAVKWRATHKFSDWRLARSQRRAARRPKTLWVACAGWISDKFRQLHGTGAASVVYHQVDLERFDGRRDALGSRLVLHDARTPNKGKPQLERLTRAFPQWRFEALNCKPEQVPQRMRKAAAFLHLSRYEGNSIVCNEAMAQNLPCLFSRVGLMQDSGRPTEIQLVEAEVAFGPFEGLRTEVQTFLERVVSEQGTSAAEAGHWQPRDWVVANASLEKNRQQWARVLEQLTALWAAK